MLITKVNVNIYILRSTSRVKIEYGSSGWKDSLGAIGFEIKKGFNIQNPDIKHP